MHAAVRTDDIAAPGDADYWDDGLTNGFLMRQTTSQCCRLCCLQPNIDWTVHKYESDLAVISDFSRMETENAPLYRVQENASKCGRTCSYCYPGFRATEYTVLKDNGGNGADDEAVLKHTKGATCPVNCLIGWSDQGQPIRCPCCCYLPQLETSDARTNKKLGTSKVLCNCSPLLCPKFGIFDAENNPKYLLQPDLCCFGQCYKCPSCKSGTKCCFIPFHIRDYYTKEKLGDEECAVIDLYIGMKHECCTKQNLYGVKFPEQFTAADKATMMGALLVYDISLNEQMN